MISNINAGENMYSQDGAFMHPAQDIRFVSLLTTFGFACFWACVITVLLSPSFFSDESSLYDILMLRALLLLGFAVIQFLSYTRILNRISDATLQRSFRIVIAIFSVLLLGAAYCGLNGMGLPLAIMGPIWFFFGISCGLLLVAWGLVCTLLDAERADSHGSSLSVSAAIVLAVILGTFMLFAPSLVVVGASGALCFVSLGLQGFCFRQFPLHESIDIETSKQRLELFSRNMITPVFSGLCCGALFVFALLAIDADWVFGYLLGSIAGGAIVALVMFALLRKIPRFSSFERFFFPILGCGFLLLHFANETVRQIILALLIADVICYLVFHWIVLVALSYRHSVRAIFHYQQGLISPLCGIAAGWCSVVFSYYGFGLTLETIFVVIPLSLVILLMLVLSIVPYTSNKTVEAIAGTIDEETREKTGSWRKRSEEVSSRFALTPREEEVFILLAKGRNTEVISKQLFISSHTVKTHTARIYRKLSINSQQELIDMVEDRLSNKAI